MVYREINKETESETIRQKSINLRGFLRKSNLTLTIWTTISESKEKSPETDTYKALVTNK
jgi:hypothetical protein